jgi:hypothetical protein
MTKGLVGAALMYFAASSAVFADQPILSSECSFREVKVITAIEDHGEAGDVSSDKLSEAGLKFLTARMTCYKGRVAEALTLYDEILLSLGPLIARRDR